MTENLSELIKKNKGQLRQLTFLNNEIKELKEKVRELELKSCYPNEIDLREMNLYEGT